MGVMGIDRQAVKRERLGSRVGNSLFCFLCESLIFFQQKSEIAIHYFPRANCSRSLFKESDFEQRSEELIPNPAWRGGGREGGQEYLASISQPFIFIIFQKGDVIRRADESAIPTVVFLLYFVNQRDIAQRAKRKKKHVPKSNDKAPKEEDVDNDDSDDRMSTVVFGFYCT